MTDNPEWRAQRKIVRLTGTPHAPATVLASTLEKASRMRAVAVVILWDDGSVDTDWSTFASDELVYCAARFDYEAKTLVFGQTSIVPNNQTPMPPRA